MILALLAACTADDPPVDLPATAAHPWLMVRAEQHQLVLDRLDREPYLSIHDEVVAHADQAFEPLEPGVWSHSVQGHNGEVTHANAFLAWLHDDADRAAKAIEGFALLDEAFENNDTWDVNIRMPRPLFGYTYAWDLMQGTPYWSDAEADEVERKLTELTGAFFRDYIDNDLILGLLLKPAQNNHPIRTATAVGIVGLAFPDHPDAETWRSFALSELDYLWGPDGRYVQADGAVSEGPFYYGFATGISAAFDLAAQASEHTRDVPRDCRNRSDLDPWTGHGCVDGERFDFPGLLEAATFRSAVEWSVALRLPSGHRPPLGDAYFNPLNGGALLTSFGGEGWHRWDWETNDESPLEMGHGADLRTHHLVWVDDTEPAEPPPWRNRLFEAGGHAVFRSGWGSDDVWALVVAESGAARKTLHDHVDGTSFSLAAYGEYLLVDPGYYKPSDLDNAVTADADSHNVILIDGQGAPHKGLLNNFGDADASLHHWVDGQALAQVEAHQHYERTDIERAVVFVDQRYLVVSDHLTSEATSPREHAWRLGGWAGYDAGGTFALAQDGAMWERDLAGVEVHVASTDPGLMPIEPVYDAAAAPHVDLFDLARTQSSHGVLDAVVEGTEPGFLAVVAPYRTGASGLDGPLAVTSLGQGDGWAAWRVSTTDGDDLVWHRGPDAPESLEVDGVMVTTDGRLAVLRLDGDFGLIARGTTLTVDGVDWLTGGDPGGVTAFE